MAQLALRRSSFPKAVIGMAGVLDSARFRTFIAKSSTSRSRSSWCSFWAATGTPWSRCRGTDGGGDPDHRVPVQGLAALVTRTANGGAEIVGLLKTGSAYYAPAASVVEMVEAILKDKKKVLPCAAYLEGEYGMKGLFVGVPAKLGRRGIEQILQITLSPDEAAALGHSAAAVRELTDKLGI